MTTFPSCDTDGYVGTGEAQSVILISKELCVNMILSLVFSFASNLSGASRISVCVAFYCKFCDRPYLFGSLIDDLRAATLVLVFRR